MDDDDNDLTDRFDEICGELEGRTLEDEWKENPDPPEGFGQPDPRTITENSGDYWWVWATYSAEASLRFAGEAMEIAQ